MTNLKLVNKVFTEMLAGLLSDGYVIRLQDMGGSQGDLGRVDLVKRGEVYRLLAVKRHDVMAGPDYVEIMLGASRLREDTRDTIWNDRLMVVKSRRVYETGIASGAFLTEDEAEARAAAERSLRRYGRRAERYADPHGYEVTAPGSAELAVRWLRANARGFKTARASEVSGVLLRNDGDGLVATFCCRGQLIRAKVASNKRRGL